MTFQELCHNNLGAADYIALAGEFHTVAVRGIPIFNSSTKSEAYRFVTLIDVLYENRIRIFCSAAGDPQDLFSMVLSQQESRNTKVSPSFLVKLLGHSSGKCPIQLCFIVYPLLHWAGLCSGYQAGKV